MGVLGWAPGSVSLRAPTMGGSTGSTGTGSGVLLQDKPLAAPALLLPCCLWESWARPRLRKTKQHEQSGDVMNEGLLVTIARRIGFRPISAQPLWHPPRLLLFAALPLPLRILEHCLVPSKAAVRCSPGCFFPGASLSEKHCRSPHCITHVVEGLRHYANTATLPALAQSPPASPVPGPGAWLLSGVCRVGSGAGRGFHSSLFLPGAWGGCWGKEQPPLGPLNPSLCKHTSNLVP